MDYRGDEVEARATYRQRAVTTSMTTTRTTVSALYRVRCVYAAVDLVEFTVGLYGVGKLCILSPAHPRSLFISGFGGEADEKAGVRGPRTVTFRDSQRDRKFGRFANPS